MYEIKSGFGHQVIPSAAGEWGRLRALELRALEQAEAEEKAQRQQAALEDTQPLDFRQLRQEHFGDDFPELTGDDEVLNAISPTVRLGGAALFPMQGEVTFRSALEDGNA